MVTEVTIMWADTEETMDVLIAEMDETPKGYRDDDIFFYGVSRAKLLRARDAHTLMEGEWYVVEVRD